MTSLISLLGCHTSRRVAALQPSVNRIAADVEHPAHLAFLFTTVKRCHYFFA
jgi:hypothetical protein